MFLAASLKSLGWKVFAGSQEMAPFRGKKILFWNNLNIRAEKK